MSRKKNVFEVLFPNWLDRLIGILGLGVFPVVTSLAILSEEHKIGLAFFLLSATLWVGIRAIHVLVDLANESTPPDIRVRTNRATVSLQPSPADDEDQDPPLVSDHSVCICVWNGGKETNCTVTLRFPSFLQLNIVEEQATGVKKHSDLYSRTFALPKGEAHFVTINKISLPTSMVQKYLESSRELRIEVTHDGPDAPQVVSSVAVLM